MAKITCGVNELANDGFNGKTINQIIDQYGQVLNIPADNCVILVNDEEVTDRNYIVSACDEIEFVKASGEKGNTLSS